MISFDDPQRLAVLVHEIRSPVAALSAIAEAFPDEGLDSGARLELSRLALTACLAIQRLVIDSAVASLHPALVDVGALVGQVVATARLTGVRIESEIPLDLPHVMADPVRLRQALDNLVGNALKHANSDGGILVTAKSSDAMVLLSVSDSGAGVPISDQGRIFEAGVRLDAGRAGSGLGLPVARAIAEAHGGLLTVSSTPGEGATFTIALPVS
jgi:two-component system sensor histidine kinase BaeS